MKLLTFQAKRFAWKSFSQTLEEGSADALAAPVEDELHEAVVAFVHAEAKDEEPAEHARVLRGAAKHLKWLANKRDLRVVVLHSFTHLGGDSAVPTAAQTFLERLAQRLAETGYTVHVTPFGYFNEWDLSVYGESLAKVWKQI